MPPPQFGSAQFPTPGAPSCDRPEWLNARVGVLAGLLVVLLAVALIAAPRASDEESSATLTEGTCFDAISLEHTGPAVFLRAERDRIVSCDDPHLAEVIGTYELESMPPAALLPSTSSRRATSCPVTKRSTAWSATRHRRA